MEEEPKILISNRFVGAVDELKKRSFIKSYKDFCGTIDIPSQSFNDIKALRRFVTIEMIHNTCNTYPISESYLVSGKGEMFVPDQIPIDVPVNDKNPKESYTKKWYNKQPATKTEFEESEDNPGYKKKFKLITDYPMTVPLMVTVDNLGHENISLVPVRAQAGYLLGHHDPHYFEKLPAFAIPGFTNDVYRAFEVSGYSMLPYEGAGIYPSDIVIASFVDHPNKIRDNRVYVLICDSPEVDNVIIKRCLNRIETNQKIICISDNKNGDYPAIILEIQDIKEVWEFKAKISRHIPPPGSVFDQLNDLNGRIALLEADLKKNKLHKDHDSNTN